MSRVATDIRSSLLWRRLLGDLTAETTASQSFKCALHALHIADWSQYSLAEKPKA